MPILSSIRSNHSLDEYHVVNIRRRNTIMPNRNYPYGQPKGKTYYAEQDDLYPIIKNHLNKPVTLQTKDGYSHNGYVQHIDDENVYLGVPNAPIPTGAQPGYQGYPQHLPPYVPNQPYGGSPYDNPYINSPFTPYRDTSQQVQQGNSRENSEQRIFGGYGPGFGGYGPGFGGYGPGFGGYGPGFGGYPGYGGYGPGIGGYGAGYGGLSSLVFPLASLAALSV
jgi:hypothetical protein